ncbi:hypothetical protein OG944_38920 (plasmid) [Streptomyces anulatus]|uniref:hypothetical protein n=1 Tax=Streptomyces anulatus TaxID=1892 RepID=UPI002F90B490
MTATVTPITAHAPVVVDSLLTAGEAILYVYEDSDGSLSSDCTGCSEYAWTLDVDRSFARAHAEICLRRPRPFRLAA